MLVLLESCWAWRGELRQPPVAGQACSVGGEGLGGKSISSTVIRRRRDVKPSGWSEKCHGDRCLRRMAGRTETISGATVRAFPMAAPAQKLAAYNSVCVVRPCGRHGSPARSLQTQPRDGQLCKIGWTCRRALGLARCVVSVRTRVPPKIFRRPPTPSHFRPVDPQSRTADRQRPRCPMDSVPWPRRFPPCRLSFPSRILQGEQ